MPTTKYRRRRKTAAERAELEAAALQRATSNPSWANFGQVIEEFAARGIPAAAISPKENVFTYNAWRALGRQVRRGEHGVKITTWVEMTKRERDETTGEEKTTSHSRPTSAVVFHISQTDPRAAAAPSSPPTPSHSATPPVESAAPPAAIAAASSPAIATPAAPAIAAPMFPLFAASLEGVTNE